ncbi:MAG: ABC transporter permease [Rubripirellula sp.]
MSDFINDSSGEPLTLGGQNEEFEYHPLAVDAEEPGFWGTIDRLGQRVADWLNPILIKEARQSLKSRQFLITFFCLLAASCFWTIVGVVSNAPDVYFVPTGADLMTGYYLVLAIPLIGMVPLAAHRSLAAEIEDDTFEMLVITKLSSMRIVMGKLNSAMLQMLVYFAAIVPCIAFSYLLRGVNLVTIAEVVAIVFFTALIITSFALMLATLGQNRAIQTLSMLGVLAVIFFAELICFAFCVEGLLQYRMGSDMDSVMFTLVFIIIGLSCVVVFVKAAAARIAPVTENRSTGLRWCMFAQQLLWMATIAHLALWYDDFEPINFGMMVLGGYWLVMGTLMLSESSELSPRVQRSLPSTFAGRSLLTWFNPGPATGYVFSVCTGTVAIAGLGLFGQLTQVDRRPLTPCLTFAMIAIGYLMSYLGLTRLISMPILRRLGSSLAVSVVTMLVVMLLAAITPIILTVMATGSAPFNYTQLEAINWGWTLIEAFENRYDPVLAFKILLVGVCITLVNLVLLFRVFRYRKISVPERVLQDKAEEQPA